MHNNPKMPASEKDEIVTTSAQKELKNVLFHSGVLEDIGQKFCNSNYQSMFNAPKVKNVEIKKYQLIDNQYYAFEVFLEYFNCQQKNVRRRYSNFLLLSQYLQFKFREIIQPPMPPKHGLCQQYFDYHNEDILKERKIVMTGRFLLFHFNLPPQFSLQRHIRMYLIYKLAGESVLFWVELMREYGDGTKRCNRHSFLGLCVAKDADNAYFLIFRFLFLGSPKISEGHLNV